MIKRVLIVDDDQGMLLTLKEGLESQIEGFCVLIAGDGLSAIEKLKKNPISLVVTDLRMPRTGMNGYMLLTYVMEEYPDVPVIIMTGYGTVETEQQARAGGASGYIEKPFTVEDLAREITTILEEQSDGGTLQGVTSTTFLQLIEMEEKTCTIRMFDKSSGKQGALFLREGELFDARVGNLRGVSAAYEIFSWDEVELSIQNACAMKKKSIKSDLQAVILEAMCLKDEAGNDEEAAISLEFEEEPGKGDGKDASEKPNALNGIRRKLEDKIGERCGLEDIYPDNSWNGLVEQMARVGSFFNVGELRLIYIDMDESNDFILLPGQDTTVISVRPQCPRERIIQILSG